MTDTTTTTRTGITFAVDRVAPVTAPLPECRAHEAVRAMVGGDIESCGDYHGTVVRDVRYQPLLAAVYTAFSQHRPLVLTPDAVWITIAQGVAHHMVLHGERLRSRFVSHQGRLELAFVTTEWVEGSPENPWPQAFASWSGQIAGHVGPEVHDRLVCDFGTTGPVERAVSQIVMMDVFERYFHYVDYCICGIPQVTLEGTPADWQRLRDKVAGLSIFDLDWWLRHLLPVCDQFVRASRGDVDLKHWQSICKLREEYGGDVINGWVAKLFPYLRAFYDGPCSRRNPVFETGEGFQTPLAPPGLSRVPFTWRNVLANRDRPMEAIGGLVGVTQDPATLALRPKVGWAVRQAEPMDVLLARLARDHATFPTAIRAHADGDGDNDGNGRRAWSGLPPDLSAFYHRTGGAELFGRGAAAACRIVPRDRIEDLDWGESPDARSGSGPGGRIWHRFAWLADGTWLAINLDRNLHLAPCADDQALWARRDDLGDSFAPVCHGSKGTNGRPGRNPVVALSFSELLERLLDGRGQPYWLDPRFKGYGDAMKYTRTV
jgi:hypothetical protein